MYSQQSCSFEGNIVNIYSGDWLALRLDVLCAIS